MYVTVRAVKELIAMTHTLASIVPKARSWVLNVSKDAMHGRMAIQQQRKVVALHIVLIVE